MNTALILSGGVGSRLGGDMPKQYIEVGGRIASVVLSGAAVAASVGGRGPDRGAGRMAGDDPQLSEAV